MENREAIEWLKGCVVSYEVDNKGRPNGNVTCDLTQEVIDLAISALEKQEQDRWIPVTERLPEKDDFVLVTISGVTNNGKSWEHTMTLAVWTGDSWDLVDADMAVFRIFAWRPLPEPYTEEES